MYVHVINHKEQNVKLTFSVSGEGHIAGPLKSAYFSKIMVVRS